MTTLHLVSHTHWDREWYLTFQQFRLKLVRLIDDLLDLLETDPDYKHFMLDGQTIVLDDYLALRPENAGVIRSHVRSGRLLIGPWHILPDEFLVSPEATIRNLLQGDRTARPFGPKMTAGYIPDPFGHIGQMPQILRGFGIETAAFRRGLSDEPCELWWEAPDGSRVFTVYLRDGYDNAAWLPTADPESFVLEVCRLRDSLAARTTAPHILLMHGTDHMPPPPDTAAALACANDHLHGDRLIHSTLPLFISALHSTLDDQLSALPTVRGELRSPKRHHLLPGVLSTRMWIKQRNHACEMLLEKWAEPFSTWASLIEDERRPATARDRLADPAPILREAWRMLMACHPHDSICGCSVDQVHDEMRTRFDQVEQVGEEITGQSLRTIAEAADTRTNLAGAQSAIVVFNPVAGPRTDCAIVQLPAQDVAIVDEQGRVLPHEIVEAETMTVRFVAHDVPGCGYRTFWTRPAAKEQPAAVAQAATSIENEFFAVEASAEDGTLALDDKRTGVVYRGLNRFVDGGDCGDEYNYCPPAADRLIRGEVQSIRTERSAAGQFIETSLRLSVPAGLSDDRRARGAETASMTLTTRATLRPGVPRLDVDTQVENPARDHRLRVHFPAPFSVDAADHDGHFEVVRRRTGLPAFDDTWVEQPRPEAPQRAFTDISDSRLGLMIANRGLPEVEVVSADGSTEIALTLLRCVGWLSRDDFPARKGHAGPMLPTHGAQMLGRWAFAYSIIPHEGDWRRAFHQAYAFSAPVRAVVTSLHAPREALPAAASMIRAAPEAFVLSAVKEAEDGEGWIARGYNIGAEAITASLAPWRKFAHAARVSLAEEVEAEDTPAPDGRVAFPARGHEIVTVKFKH